MRVVVDAGYEGCLLREFLRRELGFSTTLLRRIKFLPDGILLNGTRVTVRAVLREGDVLDLRVEDREEDMSPYIVPAELPIGIVFEDASLTVVDKPFGMPAHPSFGHRTDTVANALADRNRGKPYVFRPINRLDRDTSGLMLTANSHLASLRLYEAMQSGRIRKVYLAVLKGTPAESAGIRVSYIRRKADSIMLREETEDASSGKIARSAYQVLHSSGEYSLVAASPLTGRTHQLRVHFLGMGCPIVGDDLYASASPLIGRQALHAATLTFPHPEDGRNVDCVAPIPADIASLIRAVFPYEADALCRAVEKLRFEDLAKISGVGDTAQEDV